MPINQNVFRAVLAMDSYNRGYRPNVNGLSDATGTMLGTASIIRNANDPDGVARRAGFYATAYSWNGETVISFRGTNINQVETLGEFVSLPALNDVFNGWSLAFGFREVINCLGSLRGFLSGQLFALMRNWTKG
jgi:hypothetical protein